MSAEELATRILQELRRRGHQAYWAGGCVRDLLLGRPPEDYDIATDALPEQIQQCFPGSPSVGARFGVVLVRNGDSEVEVATFRTDHDYRDGRHPARVDFTRSAQQDVQRRDFTINGLLFDPVGREVLDYVGGRADLEAGLIRAIGDAALRFREDRLRMLRAVRFAARFGFSIDPATMEAIQAQAPRILEISPERIRDELSRILTEGQARRGFELLDKSGLLAPILPEVAAMKGVAQPPEFHPEGDVWVHTLLMLEGLRHPSVTLALGVLLHDVGKPPTFRVAERIRFDGHVEEGARIAEEICTRLRYSREQTEQVLALVGHHMRFRDVPRMRESTLKRFMRLPQFEEHLELHRLDCLGSHRDLGNYELVREKLATLPEEQLRPRRLLSGEDLIAQGYSPGPSFKAILSEVEDAQLEGRITSKADALEMVRRQYAPPDGKKHGGPTD